MSDREVFVRLRPDLAEEERTALIRFADIVADRLTNEDELCRAVSGLLKHHFDAIADDFKKDKRSLPVEEAGREDERTRHLMYGVDEASGLLCSSDVLTELRSRLHEYRRKQ